MGTREHIIAYLSEANELFDANGMASTQLAAAVGYPGSSVAFAQLLSGMERSGLIEREVRGKRTYRISLGPAHAAGAARAAGRPGLPGGGTARVGGVPDRRWCGGRRWCGVGGGAVVGGGAEDLGDLRALRDLRDEAGAIGFDYDELARRLLVQLVRRLAAVDPGLADRSAENRSAPDRSCGPDRSALQEKVTGLEHELAAAWTRHGQLAEENVRLREQLQAAQRSLAQAAERVRRLPASTDLDSSEVMLLQRLLAPGGADSGDSGIRGLR